MKATRLAVIGPASRFRAALTVALGSRPGLANLDVESADAVPAGVDTAIWAAPRSADPAQGADGLATAVAAGVRRLVVVSSTAVHEPNAHHPGLVAETFRGSSRTGNPLPARWRELEATASGVAATTDVVLTVLRPAPVLVPGGDDVWSRTFRRFLVLTLPGFDPTLQLLDLSDLAAAIEAAVRAPPEQAAGTFHVAPAGVVPLRKAIRLAGGHRLPLPRWLQRLVRRHPEELEGLRYPATVDASAIGKRLGVVPTRSSAQAVAAHAGRRPPAPEPIFDSIGFDRAYTDRLGRTLFRFLHDVWWRIESEGLEQLPKRGRVVLVGTHRGFQPWDGVMTLHHLATRTGRYPRFLIHPTLVKFPFLAPYMTKLGGLHASAKNAARILEGEEIVGVYPEGIRGAFTPYRRAYAIGPSWRDDFARLAIRHRAPIAPFVTVGSAETYPIFGRIDWPAFKRWSEWPYLPITPTLGLVPLPSKWHLSFLEPVPVEPDWGPEAARDRERVRELSLRVRGRVEQALGELRERRPGIFWGRLRPPRPAGEADPKAGARRLVT